MFDVEKLVLIKLQMRRHQKPTEKNDSQVGGSDDMIGYQVSLELCTLGL